VAVEGALKELIAAQAALAEAEEDQAAALRKASYWMQAREYSQGGLPKSAVVWLHGQGEIEGSWAEILPDAVCAPEEARPCRWIWPRGEFSPCTSRGGAMTLQWFDTPEFPVCHVVRGLPDRPRREEDPKEIAASVRVVHAAVAALEAEGIACRQIVVGGFGQGAALAAHAVLRYERPLAGGVLLSAWVPCLQALSQAATAVGRSTDLLWCHGSRDSVVLPSVAADHVKALRDLGVQVEYRLMPELGFSMNDEVLQYFQSWLCKHLLARQEPSEEPGHTPKELEQVGEEGSTMQGTGQAPN